MTVLFMKLKIHSIIFVFIILSVITVVAAEGIENIDISKLNISSIANNPDIQAKIKEYTTNQSQIDISSLENISLDYCMSFCSDKGLPSQVCSNVCPCAVDCIKQGEQAEACIGKCVGISPSTSIASIAQKAENCVSTCVKTDKPIESCKQQCLDEIRPMLPEGLQQIQISALKIGPEEECFGQCIKSGGTLAGCKKSCYGEDGVIENAGVKNKLIEQLTSCVKSCDNNECRLLCINEMKEYKELCSEKCVEIGIPGDNCNILCRKELQINLSVTNNLRNENVTVRTEGGKEIMDIDKSKLEGNITKIIMKDSAGNEAAEMITELQDTREISGRIEGTIKNIEMTLKEQQLRAAVKIGEKIEEIGIKAQITANLNKIPEDASVNMKVLNVVDKDKARDFETEALKRGLKIAGRAGSIRIDKINMKNIEDVKNATVTFKIDKSWLGNASVSQIKILKESDEGITEITETSYAGEENGQYIFTGISLNGLSTFAVFVTETITTTGTEGQQPSAALPELSKYLIWIAVAIIIVFVAAIGIYLAMRKRK